MNFTKKEEDALEKAGIRLFIQGMNFLGWGWRDIEEEMKISGWLDRIMEASRAAPRISPELFSDVRHSQSWWLHEWRELNRVTQKALRLVKEGKV